MKITCQSCQAKYNVADEKVQGKIVKIRCRKCGATIVAQGNGANGSASRGPTPPAAFAGDDVQWHVNLGGDADPRTMSLRELIDAYNTGTVTQDTFIWADGMDDWKPLSEVESVVAALHADAAGDAPPPSAYEVGPTEPEPAAAPLPAFASSAGESPQPGYEAPTAIASFAMQPQAEVAVEPKRAAVKREARNRDLFASRVANEDVQTSAPAAPHMMAHVGSSASSGGGLLGASAGADTSKLTGERNENSVLFSLAVLTKDSGGSDDAPAPAAKNVGEDSGLIDLKALAAKAESVRPRASATADAGMFAPPLGLGPAPLGAPLGAFGVAVEEKPKSMLPLLIGGGAGAAVLGILCVFVGMKLAGSGAAPAAPSATASATAAPAPTVDPSATASAAPGASATGEPSATASAAAPKPKPTPAPVVHASPAPVKAASTAGSAPAPAPAPPPAKKGPSSDCGCNGDLMCLMKCSAH